MVFMYIILYSLKKSFILTNIVKNGINATQKIGFVKMICWSKLTLIWFSFLKKLYWDFTPQVTGIKIKSPVRAINHSTLDFLLIFLCILFDNYNIY